jgi:phosphoribosyl 1,2-cyclic phosphodiesterase
VLDLGTGLRYFGLGLPEDAPFRGTCLLSHLHWDHVQGLPFFTPLLRHDSELDIYAPAPDGGASLDDVMWRTINPPLFPVGLDAFPGRVTFHPVTDQQFAIGEVQVMSRLIPHVGPRAGTGSSTRAAASPT